jgi:hypothetical protein
MWAMLFTRRINPLLQRAKWTWSDLCRNRPLVATLVGAGLVLNACGAPQEDVISEDAEIAVEAISERTANVTNAFRQSDPAQSLAFLPNREAPWTGLLVSSLEAGGFDVFNVDGLRVISTSGEALNGLVAAPDFALRGETFPLLFGADRDGRLRGYAVIVQAEDIVELPLEGTYPDALNGLCFFNSGIGYVDLALLSRDGQAFIVRVRDGGGTGLELSIQNEFALPYAADHCASDLDALVISSPAAGLSRVSLDGETEASNSQIGLTEVSFTNVLGRPSVITVSAEDGLFTVYDAQTLQPYSQVTFGSGLSAPALQKPSTHAVSNASFGGMSFTSGLIAVYDRGDNRIKVIAREVLPNAIIDLD